jgi:hypothetical protein
MLAVIISLLAGMAIGFAFRQKEKIIKLADKLTTVSICLLLFLLGLSVGGNQKVLSAFTSLGFVAAVLSLGAISGSIIVTNIIYNRLFKVPRR